MPLPVIDLFRPTFKPADIALSCFYLYVHSVAGLSSRSRF